MHCVESYLGFFFCETKNVQLPLYSFLVQLFYWDPLRSNFLRGFSCELFFVRDGFSCELGVRAVTMWQRPLVLGFSLCFPPCSKPHFIWVNMWAKLTQETFVARKEKLTHRDAGASIIKKRSWLVLGRYWMGYSLEKKGSTNVRQFWHFCPSFLRTAPTLWGHDDGWFEVSSPEEDGEWKTMVFWFQELNFSSCHIKKNLSI